MCLYSELLYIPEQENCGTGGGGGLIKKLKLNHTEQK